MQSICMLERTAQRGDDRSAPAVLLRRRAFFFVLVATSIAGLIWLAVIALSPSGFGVARSRSGRAFAVTLPWYVIGFWNATIGLLIMRFARDPVAAVTPVAARVRGDEPITASTAILMCIRNEPPERVIRHLAPLLRPRAPEAGRFHVYVLSDTSEAALAAAEDARFAAFADTWRGRIGITYRRRDAQYRLQGRQHPRFLRPLGRRPRFCGAARRRQPDDRRHGAASGAHDAGRREAWHPAKPRHRYADDQRVRAHLPVRDAAWHALLHDRQRVVAGRLRPLLGPQRASCGWSRSWRIASFRCCEGARWAATCSATTRSRRC